MSSNQSSVLCFSNTEVSDVKRYCLVNLVWPFVKTDDDCVHWIKSQIMTSILHKNTRNKTVHNNILYLSGTCTCTAKWPESQLI